MVARLGWRNDSAQFPAACDRRVGRGLSSMRMMSFLLLARRVRKSQAGTGSICSIIRTVLFDRTEFKSRE